MRRLCLCVPVFCLPLAVLAQDSITVSAQSLSLSYTKGTNIEPTASLTVGTTGAPATQLYTNFINVGTPHGFLNVPSSFQSTPITITVGAGNAITPQNPTSVLERNDLYPPGVYTAMFSIGGTGAATSPVVTVTLTILAAPVCPAPALAGRQEVGREATPVPTGCPLIGFSSSSVSFTVQAGSTVPATSFLSVGSTTGANQPFSVAVSDSCGGCITADNSTGVAPATGFYQLPVVVNALNLPASSTPFTGTITLTSSGTTPGPPVTAKVSVNVISGPVISLSTPTGGIGSSGSSSLTLFWSPGYDSPVDEVDVVSTAPTVSATLSVAPSLTGGCPAGAVIATPSAASTTGKAPIFVTLDPSKLASLSAGTSCFADGLLTAASGGITQQFSLPFTVKVALNFLVVDPPTLNVPYPSSSTELPNILVNSTNGTLTFAYTFPPSLEVTDSGVDTTPGVIFVRPVAAAFSGLPPGVYKAGDIVVTAAGAANSPIHIPVTVTVGPNWSLIPNALTFQTAAGSTAPLSQSVSVHCGCGNFTVTPSEPWMKVTQNTLTSPETGAANVQLTVDPTGKLPGNHLGQFTFAPVGGGPKVKLPVSLIVSTDTPPVLIESFLNRGIGYWRMWYATHGTDDIGISSSTSDGSSLTVNPATVTGPVGARFAIAIKKEAFGSGPTGWFTLPLTPAGASSPSIVEPGVFTSSTSGVTSDTPAAALYNWYGGDAVYSALVNIVTPATSDTILSITDDDFLTVEKAIGLPTGSQLTPRKMASSAGTTQAFTISVKPSAVSSLNPGAYSGSVTFAGSAAGERPLTLPVSLVIGTAPPVAVVNGASGASGAVSPGEFVSIFPTNSGSIGPTPAQGLTLTSTGTVSTNLGNTQVLFDGVPAALAYAGSGQINAIVPYEVGGQQTTYMTVVMNGNQVGAANLVVTDSVPSLVALSGGTGEGAVVNQDGTINATSNPAPAGTVITFFGTGEGMLTPAVLTGAVTASTGTTFPAPVLPVTLTIGGQAASISYAGESPGFASGVLQINAMVPSGTASGAQPVVVTIGNVDNSAQGITVQVQ